MSFTVAIVGRPNVGKSTLFNRLAGRRLALVDDTPGVTRDRREATAQLGNLTFTIIDTAGLEDAPNESLTGRMRAQTEAAVAAADAVFFVIDARAGVVPADRAFVSLLRRAGKPTVLVANKSEGRAGAARALEGYDLGLGEPVPVSAEHGEGLADLYDALREALPELTAPERADAGRDGRGRGGGRRRAGTAAPHRGGRPAQRRQVDPDQPADRRGAPAHRPRGRHHPRRHRGADSTGRAAIPGSRHRRHAAQRSRIENKLEKLSVGDALDAITVCRGGDPADGRGSSPSKSRTCASPISSSARDAPSSSASTNGTSRKVIRARPAGCAARPITGSPSSGGCRSSRCPASPGAGLDRLMQAVLDIHALWNKRIATNPTQPLARGDAGRASAARGVRPAAQAQLHHPAQGAAAELRAVLHPRRCGAGRLSPLSRQRPARGLRPAGRADPAHVAGEGEPVCGEEEAGGSYTRR